MPTGTRNDSITDQDIVLYFQFLKNGAVYSANEVQKVEIYPTYDDAVAGTNIIETITSGNITEVTTGKYSYTVSALDTASTYFDKIFIIPDVGVNVMTFINPFYVRMEQYGGAAPGDHEKVRIYLNLYDILDNPQIGDCVKIRMNESYALYGNDFIEREEEEFTSDSEGQIVMDLIETDTLTADTFTDPEDVREIYYEANIIGQHFIKFKVPKGTVQANFFDDDAIPKVADE